MKLDKRTYLAIGIVIVSIGIIFLCLYYAGHNNGIIQIPVWQMLKGVTKACWEWTVGLLWLFIKMFWIAVTSSWVPVVVVLGLIVMSILFYFYRRQNI